MNLQIKQGNNLIAGLRATNEIPSMIMLYDDRPKEISSFEKIGDTLELKVSTKIKIIVIVVQYFFYKFINFKGDVKGLCYNFCKKS